jgi:hypothetical protein
VTSTTAMLRDVCLVSVLLLWAVTSKAMYAAGCLLSDSTVAVGSDE